MTMEDEKAMTETRELWSSRTTFLLAAIGAAVGYGNVWRFPALVHEYGGGIFFFPCLLALFLIGIPVLLLEIAMGQHVRNSDIAACGYLSKHFRGVGLASILGAFCVMCYYVPLLSWCLRIWFESFGSMKNEWEEVNGSGASIYFLEAIIGTNTLDEDRLPSRIVFANVFYLLLTWGLVGCCLVYEIHFRGRVAYITMGLPVIMLFVVFIRASTLPGAKKGMAEYTHSWEWSTLVERPDIWSTAVAQIFFSLGVAFGVMTAFGSHCEKNAPAFQNSLIIAGSNWAFSFMSGLCVFGILGYIMEKQGDYRVEAGSAFLFSAYPAAFSTIPGGLHWIRVLFFSFFFLGLNSAMAMVEAIVSVMEDSTFYKLPKHQLIAGVCSAGFLGGLLYTTDAALQFLTTVDFYMDFILLFLGFCKTFSAGWMYNIQKQIKVFGYSVIYVYLLASFGSVILASLVWFGVAGNTILPGILCFVVVYGMGVYYCYEKLDRMENKAEGYTMRVLCDEIIMGNILDLKVELEGTVGYIPYAWAVLMKHVIPQALLILFFNLAYARTDHGQMDLGDYGDYRVWPYQMIGLSVLVIVLILVGVGLVNARLFDIFIEGAASKPEPTDEDFEMVEKDQANDYVPMADGQMVEKELPDEYQIMEVLADHPDDESDGKKKPMLHLV